jgi:hypothetical protein
MYFHYTISFVWLWSSDIKTKGYKKTCDSDYEIHEMQSKTVHFTKEDGFW